MTDLGSPANKPATRVPALFAALVDDAGLFPPEQLPMDAAVARHRSDAAVGNPVLTQRFLCKVSELGELRRRLRVDERWQIGLIADAGLEELAMAVAVVRNDRRFTLETVELRLPGGDPDPAVNRLLGAIGRHPVDCTYVELSPARVGWEQSLAAVVRAGLAAKVRCGGLSATDFPTEAQLAGFLLAVTGRQVQFKATAGLHHALRYRDPATGFDHHGFLNLLLATCRASDGDDPAQIEAALRIDDPTELADQARAVSPHTAKRARALFRAYGSCSTSEPVEDLTDLGLLKNGDNP